MDLQDGRVFGQEGAVIRQDRNALRLDLGDRGSQGHVSERLVVAIGLSVGGAVNELGLIAVRDEAALQAGDKVLARSRAFSNAMAREIGPS